MSYAPIAIFIYNRASHTRQTLEALIKCADYEKSPVYVFCDGPKHREDETHVQMARDVAKTVLGDKVYYIYSKSNRGLANSIIFGAKTFEGILPHMRYINFSTTHDKCRLIPLSLIF